jgi:hypothetical protein
MQTFLPYGSNFSRSASSLDNKRLGKQRVENLQILGCLAGGQTTGWKNHPAVRMWKGYECTLFRYQMAICQAWTRKGYKDTCFTKSFKIMQDCPQWVNQPDPWWLENEEAEKKIMLSHRSNLIRKLPGVYQPYWPNIPDDLPYYWPV